MRRLVPGVQRNDIQDKISILLHTEDRRVGNHHKATLAGRSRFGGVTQPSRSAFGPLAASFRGRSSRRRYPLACQRLRPSAVGESFIASSLLAAAGVKGLAI